MGAVQSVSPSLPVEPTAALGSVAPAASKLAEFTASLGSMYGLRVDGSRCVREGTTPETP